MVRQGVRWNLHPISRCAQKAGRRTLCLWRVRAATLAWVVSVVSCAQIHNALYNRIVPHIQRARSVVAVAHNYSNAIVGAGYNEICGAFGMLLNVAP